MRTWMLALLLILELHGVGRAAECGPFQAAEAHIKVIIEGAPDNETAHVRVIAVRFHDGRGAERDAPPCRVTVVTTGGEQVWELSRDPNIGTGIVAQRDRALGG